MGKQEGSVSENGVESLKIVEQTLWLWHWLAQYITDVIAARVEEPVSC
jgi:hypothetical protein